MNANARTVAVAVVCLLALGLAAATLPHPDPLNGGSPGSGTGGGLGSGSGFLPGQQGGQSNGSAAFGGPLIPLSDGFCYPVLTTSTFYLAAALAALLVLGLVYWRTNGYVVFVVAVLFGTPLVFVHALLTSCGFDQPDAGGSSAAPPRNGSFLSGGGGDGGLGPAAAHVTATNPVLLALAFVVVAAAAVVFLRSTGDDEEEETVVDPPAPPEDLDAVGRVAGEAADRIESAGDVENEVYRAWRELTDLLDVDDPATTTPAEFADAARDAGMRERDVRTLTDLFREVRYGGADPDADDRADRAVDALRRIEATYGEDAYEEDSDGSNREVE